MRDGYRGVLANPQIRFLSECRHEMAPAVLDARTVHAFPASNSSNEQPIIVRVRAEPVEERPDPRDPVRRLHGGRQLCIQIERVPVHL